NILMIIDINDPANPKEAARWWFPGQWTGGGEKPGEDWVEPDRGLREGLPKIWTFLHDITTYKDRAYLAYRDHGVIIMYISDIRKPTMVSQIKWSPPRKETHTALVSSFRRTEAGRILSSPPTRSSTPSNVRLVTCTSWMCVTKKIRCRF